jgi:predicted metal-dependent hydrolase
VPRPWLPPDVDVRRSRKRLRTVTAYREGGRTVVLIPARFTSAQEYEWVTRMLARLSAQDRRRRPGDADLAARAVELSRRYLGGLAQPASVAWAGNQNTRWGSCTPADRSIRLSTRLQGMPSWVIDYVLLHELAHLVEQGHGPAFWRLLEAYPRTERARGFLEGFAAARRIEPGPGPDVDDGPDRDLTPDGALHGDSEGDPDDDSDSDDDSDDHSAGDVDGAARDASGVALREVPAQSEPAS